MAEKKNIAPGKKVKKRRIQTKLAKKSKIKSRINDILDRKRAKKNNKNAEKKRSIIKK